MAVKNIYENSSRTNNYKDLLLVLTQKEIKVRYKNNVLGYLWSIANPLAFAFVFYVAFKVIMRFGMKDYTVFLIAGLFPWQWLSNSVNISPGIFLSNVSIIKKIRFPRNIIPLATVLQDAFHFAVSIPVIVLFLFIYERTPSLSWFYGIPILICIQIAMAYGLALAISSINLFFRDMERITNIAIMFMFYFTPILYPEDMLPETLRPYLVLNPLAPLIISWRKLFLDGLFDVDYTLVSAAYALISVVIGLLIYRKLSWKFAEVL